MRNLVRVIVVLAVGFWFFGLLPLVLALWGQHPGIVIASVPLMPVLMLVSSFGESLGRKIVGYVFPR